MSDRRANEYSIAAHTVWGEARGEPALGMRAVAWVIRNRRERGGWYGGDLAAVCKMPWQFSCWNPRDPNREKIEALSADDPGYLQCVAVVEEVMGASKKADPTAGATHYHSRHIARPLWAQGRKPCATIGNHMFYNNVN